MKILIASSIYPEAIERLQEEHDVICAFNATEEMLKETIADREVLIFRSGVRITGDVMASAPNLKLLIRAGCGLDNIDMDWVRKRRLQLVRIPEPAAKAVSEMAFALMLALSRNLLQADHLTRQGRWAKREFSSGYLLTGKMLGIIGAGNIGSRTGQLGAAWGMDVIGCVEFPTLVIARQLRDKGIQLTSCDEVLARADFLCVHVPLAESTRHLINADAIARMKPGAFLINLARGGVVDEEALREALVRGHLRGAALDVHADEGEGMVSPLADLPNVILTPHIGSGTIDSQREIGERVIEIIQAFLAEQSEAVLEVEQAVA
ncbi:MAG: hydroxyacid dehydrogenase [Chloroflexota bacterium]|nr:hydroxyacid dehydrogenase [Chloroflexota bacterium]